MADLATEAEAVEGEPGSTDGSWVAGDAGPCARTLVVLAPRSKPLLRVQHVDLEQDVGHHLSLLMSNHP